MDRDSVEVFLPDPDECFERLRRALAVNHEDHFVIGDAHTNSYENRHSFVRQWLGRFRGVSKHPLQGYLDHLAVLLNDDADWFSKILSYDLSG